jgi:hypothetical protein
MSVQILCDNALTHDISGLDISCMITDPPYRDHVHRNATSNSPGRGVRHNDLGFSSLTNELRDRIVYYASNVNTWSLVYSDVESLGDWKSCMESAGVTYVRPLAWVRWSSPQLSGDRPPTGFELVTCYWGKQGGRKSWNGPGNLTHLSHKCLRGEGKHKTEKPLDQVLDLVEFFSNPGDLVFDPCAGAGTTALACKLLGRDCISLEIDPVWAEKAYNRVVLATNLSDRDSERYERWLQSKSQRDQDMIRMKEINQKMRNKWESKEITDVDI